MTGAPVLPESLYQIRVPSFAAVNEPPAESRFSVEHGSGAAGDSARAAWIHNADRNTPASPRRNADIKGPPCAGTGNAMPRKLYTPLARRSHQIDEVCFHGDTPLA